MFTTKDDKTSNSNALMSEAEYIDKRVEDQISWYEKKSGSNKRKYQFGQLLQLILASLITLSGTFTEMGLEWLPFAIPVCGAIIAIISGILGLYKFQENWLQYRTTSEALKREKYLYITRSEPYSGTDALSKFASTIENLISQENSGWQQYQQSDASAEG